MNYALILDSPSPSECARRLAQVRQDRTRELIRSTARQMNLDMGRDVPEVLRG